MKRASRVAVLVPFLVACASGSGGEGARPGAVGEAEHATPEHGAEEHAAMHQEHVAAGHEHAAAVPGVHPADVKFMQDMIGHHAQALVMAAMAPTHGAGPKLLKLAEKIDISQRDEIEMMRQWLTDRKQPVPDANAHAMHGMDMPGMLTPEQMAQLDGARGREFERLFLTFMIRHHEGALQMVDELTASPGAAQDSDIFRFVTDVSVDQLDEIDQMQYLLDILAANPGSDLR